LNISKEQNNMSTSARSKSVELLAILIGGISILASVYFLFLAEDSYNVTNKIISLAFLVFVVYNFLNMRGLKGEIGALTDKNAELSGNLASTKSELVQAQADLETVKTDLVTAQQENEKRKAEVDRLKSKLKED
tara:strand:+ start:910 stop:1311 length:402 start_codon:yes stop_codon:yes gene_type:complete